MRTAIIEDEPLALKRIERIIQQHRPAWEIAFRAQSVRELQTFFKKEQKIDLMLCDIHLADGLSFKAFKDTNPSFPIIFITAYDEYALRSFEHNCVDYILKPIDEKRMIQSFEKLESLNGSQVQPQMNSEFFEQMLHNYQVKPYKKRFLSKIGKRVKFIPVEEISYFYSEGGVTYLVEKEGSKKYLIDHSLQELEEGMLDPMKFHRINRSTIIHLDGLVEMKPYINGRLLLSMTAVSDTKIVVARERVNEFKNWINQ
ncbi:LytR/AlgR family response regulator transcription factor [Mongoliibacter ruber]|uniref:DNA-binding LytR/AlgR family response regulator n=1 Tax=Mongoliibacter ruber TaxID=1750599 RepID=A0A2T0WL61_9BACT|nr:LytTR family DNA-binding domain-containing protein [Mongoliibacter ruber]PRY87427.1 DNA-binding LytR/AlgR family response regulator [Mongoliibacter ruber]